LVERNRMRQCLGAHGGLANRAQHHGMRLSRGQAASLRDPHHCSSPTRHSRPKSEVINRDKFIRHGR
jgi:hypothetical protein